MATSSLLGGTDPQEPIPGKDTDALGPSDNSDSGSDAQGAYGDGELHSDSDAVGTGERATVGDGRERPGQDILPDHVERLPNESDGRDDADLDALDDDSLLEDIDSIDVEAIAEDDTVEDGDEGEGGDSADSAR